VPHIVRLNEDGSLDTGFHLDVADALISLRAISGKVVASVNWCSQVQSNQTLVRFDIAVTRIHITFGPGHRDLLRRLPSINMTT